MDNFRRKNPRIRIFKEAKWDYYTAKSITKYGFIENLSKDGCLLRTSEIIDSGRWVRILLVDNTSNLCFSLFGRVVRIDERINSWRDSDITLFNCGIEFTRPVNEMLFNIAEESYCSPIIDLLEKNLGSAS